MMLSTLAAVTGHAALSFPRPRNALDGALDARSAERAVEGAGAVVAHKRRWLRRNGRDLGGNDDDDLAYG